MPPAFFFEGAPSAKPASRCWRTGANAYVERKGERDDDEHGKLGADGDGESDAEQENAAPVPQNNFARCVESVGDGDGGEDGPKDPQAAAYSPMRRVQALVGRMLWDPGCDRMVRVTEEPRLDLDEDQGQEACHREAEDDEAERDPALFPPRPRVGLRCGLADAHQTLEPRRRGPQVADGSERRERRRAGASQALDFVVHDSFCRTRNDVEERADERVDSPCARHLPDEKAGEDEQGNEAQKKLKCHAGRCLERVVRPHRANDARWHAEQSLSGGPVATTTDVTMWSG